jgi:site-specific recombinase XerD
VTAQDLVRLYLDEKAPAWTPVSVVTTGRKLVYFTAFMEGRPLTRSSVWGFVAHIRAKTTKEGRPWAAATTAGVLAAARTFLEWAELRGHVLESLSSYVVPPRFSTLPRTLGEKEVKTLLEAPQRGPCALRNRAVLELLYGTGLRRTELARLEVNDVDLQAELVMVRQGKGRKDRVVPLGTKASKAVLLYLRHERPRLAGPLFLSAAGGAITARAVEGIVADAGRRVGLGKPASPHRLRHSCATHLLRNGADLPSIKALLGHASLHSTQVYTAVDVGDLRAMIERCHPRGR